MKMKRNDLLLIIGMLVGSGLLFFIMRFVQAGNTTENAMAVVTVAGEEYARYPLDEDRVETIAYTDDSYNTLLIEGGYASISEASCPDKICVRHSKIHYSSQSIVCLPNELVVEVVGGEQDDIDASTN